LDELLEAGRALGVVALAIAVVSVVLSAVLAALEHLE